MVEEKLASDKRDHELGMTREITRRDFLNGVAIGTGATLLGGSIGTQQLFAAAAFDEFAPEKAADYYPPTRTGIRGNHDGSFTFAHRMRDGEPVSSLGDAVSTGETYDLVIIGGGISGLAAAYRFRQKTGRNAKILILDNHDDFGGHAKRNEFQAGGRMVLSYGGTQSIRNWHRHAEILQGVRFETLREARHGGLFRQGDFWRGSPGHRDEHHAVGRISGESAAL
jgi:spermidine dehydrogenase